MINTQKGKAFVEEIKALGDGLEKLKLKNIDIIKADKLIRYNFICDKVLDKSLRDKILSFVTENSPTSFISVEATFQKIVTDKELVSKFIFSYILNNFPSIVFGFEESDVFVTDIGDTVKYTVRLMESGKKYFESGKILQQISDELSSEFCDNFSGEVLLKEGQIDTKIEQEIIKSDAITSVNRRHIKVTEVEAIDDITPPDTALYIEDSIGIVGDVVLAGKITEIKEKESAKGKKFYIFGIADGTGRTSGVYFTRKNTVEKIKELKVDDEIIVSAKIETYNDRQSMRIEKINRCVFPKDFVPEKKVGKAAPLEYKTVFPEKMTEIVEVDMFHQEVRLPEFIRNNTFVVFDLETTGTNAGADEITEIGAVKMVNGKVTEKFLSFVKPDGKIPERITELTGIDDEMVKDAPKMKDVISDFFKFSRNAILVGHNAADFDIKFIKRYAKEENYVFDNELIDTYPLSVKVLPQLGRHKLNNVAEHYGIKFLHHRAWSDAYATAQVLIELYKTLEK